MVTHYSPVPNNLFSYTYIEDFFPTFEAAYMITDRLEWHLGFTLTFTASVTYPNS